jgi:hypothetical protein
MSVYGGLHLIALGGFLWILAISVVWMLLYAYGEKNGTVSVPSK